MSKELLITQCTDPLRWYAGKVGERVPYLGPAGADGHKSREPAGHVNFVQQQDAKIVDAGA